MRVGVYARVSSERQAQQATIESQTAALLDRARADGHTILPQDVYVDDGYSGTTLRRPALEQLRDRIADGGLDVLYVHSPDRLARKYAYQVLLLEEFRKGGVTPTFLNGPSGQTAEDELLVQVQGMIAEYERAKIVERTRRGRLYRAKQGSVSVMCGAPYGYVYVKRNDSCPASYRVLLHEAKIVREIFHALVREQKSLGAIARKLNDDGVPTRYAASGSKWYRSTIRAIVINTAYIGKAAFGKTECVEPQARLRPRRPRNGKVTVPRYAKTGHRKKSKEDWILIDVPALVPQDVFDAAQEQLVRNKHLVQSNRYEGQYLLSGLTVCARCGYAVTGRTTRRREDLVFRYYVCSGNSASRFPNGRACHMPVVRADQLDGYVWQSIAELLLNPDRVLNEWARRQRNDGVTADLRARRDDAARNLAACERNLKRLVDAYEAGAIDLPDLKVRSEAVRSRLQRAERESREADHALHQTTEVREIVARIEDFAERVKTGLDGVTWLERREIVRALVARVEIDEAGATIVYRVPANAPTTPQDGPSGPNEASRSGGTPAGAGTAASAVGHQSRESRTRSQHVFAPEFDAAKATVTKRVPHDRLGRRGRLAMRSSEFRESEQRRGER